MDNSKWTKAQWAMYAAGLEALLRLYEKGTPMKTKIINYDDWGNFIQMDKGEWNKLQRQLKARGLVLEKVGGDGPVTKYRQTGKTKK